ncbi:MAG: TRAP transporter small permease [Alphaproteobacteria bacterium]
MTAGAGSASGRARLGRVLRRLIAWWALAGGFVLVALVVMTAASALSNLAFDLPFAPDYELVKHFTAVAVFAFLPYCQLTGANISVDIFTERMGTRGKAVLALLGAIFALAFAAVLAVQMVDGMLGYVKYQEVTAVLKLPLWTAYPPALLSLALLVCAAVISICEAVDAIRSPDHGVPAHSIGME